MKTFEQWQDAANLQNSVYQPFVEWLRQKGWSNIEISRCMDIEKHEFEYWKTCVATQVNSHDVRNANQLELIEEFNK